MVSRYVDYWHGRNCVPSVAGDQETCQFFGSSGGSVGHEECCCAVQSAGYGARCVGDCCGYDSDRLEGEVELFLSWCLSGNIRGCWTLDTMGLPGGCYDIGGYRSECCCYLEGVLSLLECPIHSCMYVCILDNDIYCHISLVFMV